MPRTRHLRIAVLLGALLVAGVHTAAARPAAQTPTTVQVYASGFVNPKQITFGPDGTLYVAEAGAPGDVTVALPSGYGGSGPIGRNGRISRVPPGSGQRQDLVTGLPNIGIYGGIEMLGASGVAFLNGQLYEVAAGHITASPLLSRVAPDGTMTTVADVGAFNRDNPPPADNGDAIPTGNPFGMIAYQGNLYITDGNYNRVLKATPDGSLSIIAAFANDPTTTGISLGPDGNFYVAQFGLEPYLAGSSHIDRVTPDGQITEGVVKNLTNAIDTAFAPDGTMYVLQFVSQFDAVQRRYAPFGGKVLRVLPDGSTQPVVTNLMFPTAMTFGPDGALYVTNYGNEGNEGEGQVLRITLGDTPATGPDVPAPVLPQSEASAAPSRSGAAPAGSATAAAPASAATVAVTIVEPTDPTQWGFSPNNLTAHVGDTVAVTNSGKVSHTMTAANGDFDTGLVKGGDTVTFTLTKPGTIQFFCQPHPWMKGTITVEGSAAPAAAGAASVPPVSVNPPSINPLAGAGFVGLIIAVVFAAGFAMRRRGGATAGTQRRGEE